MRTGGKQGRGAAGCGRLSCRRAGKPGSCLGLQGQGSSRVGGFNFENLMESRRKASVTQLLQKSGGDRARGENVQRASRAESVAPIQQRQWTTIGVRLSHCCGEKAEVVTQQAQTAMARSGDAKTQSKIRHIAGDRERNGALAAWKKRLIAVDPGQDGGRLTIQGMVACSVVPARRAFSVVVCLPFLRYFCFWGRGYAPWRRRFRLPNRQVLRQGVQDPVQGLQLEEPKGLR